VIVRERSSPARVPSPFFSGTSSLTQGVGGSRLPSPLVPRLSSIGVLIGHWPACASRREVDADSTSSPFFLFFSFLRHIDRVKRHHPSPPFLFFFRSLSAPSPPSITMGSRNVFAFDRRRLLSPPFLSPFLRSRIELSDLHFPLFPFFFLSAVPLSLLTFFSLPLTYC